ncbi:MAG: CinA family nicotinamide mononucleotide deamidase-related protein [Gemmatimonadetes bacterium]|nr:CinA family nicotinamide mononucleotide deamidase-related protein [Gemmatimonadota bacterium]
MSSSGKATVGATVVTVGDELLLGQTVDTNAAWLGRELASRGVRVLRRWTVADDTQEIRSAVAAATRDADLVVVTGGLGPTPDDMTRDVVAELLGLPLIEDHDVLDRIRARYHEAGMGKPPESTRRLAQVPKGARKLTNPHGTAPGLAMEAEGGALVVLLPGIPRELRGIFLGDLDALLSHRFGSRLPPVHLHLVHTTGIPESRLAQRVAEKLPDGAAPASLAFLPDVRGVDLRFTMHGLSEADAEDHVRVLEDTLREVLEPWRFEAGSGDLAEAVAAALRMRGKLLAVAESCTGGLVMKRLTDVPGASDVLVGGVVAYANEVKAGVLGVDAVVLAREGAVSEAVARGMALEVAHSLHADAGIGVTGVAGPGGGTDAKPVGTVWYAAALDGRSVTKMERFPGDRESVRERAGQAALFLLLRLLDGRISPDD